MNSLVYLSHSYRPRDAIINDYFVRLMETEGLIASLDPPSTTVNSAKLERHLGQSDAMIAILTTRDSGVSPHILYEIALGVRSRKPLLVFVEDTLPAAILPERVLQRRFSFRSFPRHVREHRQSLANLRDYIGEPPPAYQGLLTPRTCLVLGGSTWSDLPLAGVIDFIERERRYHVVTSRQLIEEIGKHPLGYDSLREIELVVAFAAPTMHQLDSFLLGLVQGICKPLIVFASDEAFPPSGNVPDEYRPRRIPVGANVQTLAAMLATELELYEEDFLDLDDEDSKDRYMRFLFDLGGRGRYAVRTRAQGMEVIMGDRYDIHGQTGAIGPNASVEGSTFNQIWLRDAEHLDLPTLTEELGRLRAALRAMATTPEQDQVVAEVGQAELAARNGNGPGALRHLRTVGKWALGAATSMGAGVAAAAIKSAIGI